MRTNEQIRHSSMKPIKEILEEVQVKNIQNREDQIQEKLTSNQLTTIFQIAREKGISQTGLTNFININFNKEILQLSIREASTVIQGLIK